MPKPIDMPELIDKKTLLEILCFGCAKYRGGICSKENGRCAEYTIIKLMPTIEPEMRHGQWIILEPYGTHHTHRRKCSECGEIKAQELTNFCPNCGAKMLNENN